MTEMCKRYLVIRSADGQVEAETDDLNQAFRHGEDVIKSGGKGSHIYERISSGTPEVHAKWNGTKRPGAGA